MANNISYKIKKMFYTFCGSSSNNILGDKETINYLLETNKSLIRYGDGEIMIIRGMGIQYQKFDIELGQSLKNIIASYNNDSNYLLALPKPALEYNIIKYVLKGQVRKTYLVFYTFRYIYKKYLDNNLYMFGNSFVFNKNNELHYSLLWKNKKNIIFVHNSKKYFYLFKSKYGYNKNCYFVKIPNENCYSKIGNIKKEVIEYISLLELTETIVLISAGPCAKELIIRINNLYAVQCIDTGHCWDIPLINRMDDN